jgi:hypothetical protein
MQRRRARRRGDVGFNTRAGSWGVGGSRVDLYVTRLASSSDMSMPGRTGRLANTQHASKYAGIHSVLSLTLPHQLTPSSELVYACARLAPPFLPPYTSSRPPPRRPDHHAAARAATTRCRARARSRAAVARRRPVLHRLGGCPYREALAAGWVSRWRRTGTDMRHRLRLRIHIPTPTPTPIRTHTRTLTQYPGENAQHQEPTQVRAAPQPRGSRAKARTSVTPCSSSTPRRRRARSG